MPRRAPEGAGGAQRRGPPGVAHPGAGLRAAVEPQAGRGRARPSARASLRGRWARGTLGGPLLLRATPLRKRPDGRRVLSRLRRVLCWGRIGGSGWALRGSPPAPRAPPHLAQRRAPCGGARAGRAASSGERPPAAGRGARRGAAGAAHESGPGTLGATDTQPGSPPPLPAAPGPAGGRGGLGEGAPAASLPCHTLQGAEGPLGPRPPAGTGPGRGSGLTCGQARREGGAAAHREQHAVRPALLEGQLPGHHGVKDDTSGGGALGAAPHPSGPWPAGCPRRTLTGSTRPRAPRCTSYS